MVVIPGLSAPLESIDKHVTCWDDAGSRLVVEAAGAARSATCPRCAQISSRWHGRYGRWIADCPSFGRPVTLIVEIQRFKCCNLACSQRTFSERIEALAATGQRRTTRLAEALRALGYALGGQAAARLAARLGMGISGATVLRELRRKGCVSPMTISIVIGIDDWALARGHRYGTIVVDLERRRPIELLAERDGATVKAWLRTQSSLKVSNSGLNAGLLTFLISRQLGGQVGRCCMHCPVDRGQFRTLRQRISLRQFLECNGAAGPNDVM